MGRETEGTGVETMDSRCTARQRSGRLGGIRRDRWAAALLTVGLALAGTPVAAPASAATITSYHIDSVAGCRQFLTAVGANLGTAERHRCTVSSEGSEVHLTAGDSLTVARGWELFVNAVVFFNEGTITNRGTFRSTDDVVNNVGHARFINHGKLVVQRCSSFNLLEDAVFVNKRGAKVDAVALWDGATAVNRGVIRVGQLTVADWDHAVLRNFGKILVTPGGSASGTVIGHQPIYAAGPKASLRVAPRTGAIYLYDGSPSGTGPSYPAVEVKATFRGCTPPELDLVLRATLEQDGVSYSWATSALGAGYYECRYVADPRHMSVGMAFYGPGLHSGKAIAHFAMEESTSSGWRVVAEDTRTVRIP